MVMMNMMEENWVESVWGGELFAGCTVNKGWPLIPRYSRIKPKNSPKNCTSDIADVQMTDKRMTDNPDNSIAK